MHVLCTGGGSAGHVVPALPVIDALLAQGHRVTYVGSRSGLEQRLLGARDVAYHGISTGKLRRYLTLENVRDVGRVIAGIWQAFVLLRRIAPDVVFSKGGFVSFPVVLAAWLNRVPVVAHESDLSPGLANRLSLPFLHTLCVNFPLTRPARFAGDVLYTGTPVRAELLAGDAARGRRMLETEAGRPVIVVTGGSLGAERLNEVARDALDALLERGDVVHVCGPGKTSGLARPGYHEFEYVGDAWGDLLAAADLVVSRAGANTLYELFCLRKPNLLVPLPRKASRGDQIENAAYAESLGYSRVIQEEALDAERLVEAVDLLLAEGAADSGRIAHFDPPDSVRLICAALERAARRGK